MEYFPPGSGLPRSTPVVYLNDGAGHFKTLKVANLVAPGNESVLGPAHLMPTRNGFSFVTPQQPFDRQGLTLTGLLATKPFRLP